MNIILLSGGSGKRLWPLSNEVRSKQFLKIFKKEDGTHESMVQRMYRMIRNVDETALITIATSENQVMSIRSQLGEKVGISIEPCRRDTFPAITLATAYLHDIQGISINDVAVVCPVDPYVEAEYFQKLKILQNQAEKEESNLILMGVEPTYPSEKYGYIIPKSSEQISEVDTFKEKPDKETAKKYISQGALWNTGVFAYKLGYVLNIAKEVFGTSSYKELFDNYAKLTKISFDYAVVEKEKKIQIFRFVGEWKDLGTWNTFTEAMSDEITGKAVTAMCENTHVINELHIPLVALGVKNLAIAATPDGILVTEKSTSDKLKDYVINQRPMYEKCIWGEYQILDYRIQADGKNSLTKHLIIMQGQYISYQRHKHRTEIWTFIEGTGKLILDDQILEVVRGDFAYIAVGKKHAIKAKTELHIIEVQIGDELTEEDVERLDLDWSEI